jgi:hypothetical protein
VLLVKLLGKVLGMGMGMERERERVMGMVTGMVWVRVRVRVREIGWRCPAAAAGRALHHPPAVAAGPRNSCQEGQC